MKRNIRHGIIAGMVCIMLIPVFLCCSEPASSGTFIKSCDTETPGLYPFTIDMTDSLCLYDMTLYTRIDATEKRFARMPSGIPLDIRLTSPGGKRYAETVYIPKEGFSMMTSFSREYEMPYRKNIRPEEYGIWKMEIEIQDEKDFPGLRGMGIKVTRK
ncbi:MAG: hypothetical protein IAB78_04070 [Bacteroidetes bacterium]|uniref:Uncharacterized protein n=1 Tax=Candidatus Cryptobacteroides excrementavium TaxID=2840759 RepID=A0A9D9NR94_9BACT|nr:hypothetical protein [Candidatus Cryptobacteroides excrementavium]